MSRASSWSGRPAVADRDGATCRVALFAHASTIEARGGRPKPGGRGVCRTPVLHCRGSLAGDGEGLAEGGRWRASGFTSRFQAAVAGPRITLSIVPHHPRPGLPAGSPPKRASGKRGVVSRTPARFGPSLVEPWARPGLAGQALGGADTRASRDHAIVRPRPQRESAPAYPRLARKAGQRLGLPAGSPTRGFGSLWPRTRAADRTAHGVHLIHRRSRTPPAAIPSRARAWA